MRFVWDSHKETENVAKHDLDFATAAQVFTDPNAITDYDDAHSRAEEDRWTTVGMVSDVLLLVRVTWTDRDGDEVIRIVSARRASAKEKAIYQQGDV
jgi:uncharacterized protein